MTTMTPNAIIMMNLVLHPFSLVASKIEKIVWRIERVWSLADDHPV